MASEVQRMKKVLKSADCVCFDVDSTVIVDEGIDELAAFLGVGEKVAQLTKSAMGGSGTFKQSLTQRLSIIEPTQHEVAKFIRQNPPRLTEGIGELVDLLKERGVDVFLVSGGFRCLIEPVADPLDIPMTNVFANRLKFFFNGSYAGFDDSQPTSDSGGKPKVMRILKDTYGYKCVVHIGDGATDLEAYPPADGFIGFGGNQIREKVQCEAPWFVTDFQELIDVLQPKNSNNNRSLRKSES